MKPTDTSERGLEELIFRTMTHGAAPETGETEDGAGDDATAGEIRQRPPSPYDVGDYLPGDPADYDREHAVDLAKLLTFLEDTQPEAYAKLGLAEDGPKRRKFLARLRGQISRRGVIDVLRGTVSDGPVTVRLFYGTPSPGNARAQELFEANLWSVTRQLRYSLDETQRALDLVLFVNGLPIFTFELKNRLTKKTVAEAVEQYKRDRNPAELLFQFGRCVAHFAVDDLEVRFCTHLQGKNSSFFPFNKGYRDGAGNPPNPDGLATDYLWRDVLSRRKLTDVLENFAQVVTKKNLRTGRSEKVQYFPRYHQLRVVHRLLGAVHRDGVGHRYLVQHSAGSGKSNSIAWLVYQLAALENRTESRGGPLFHSIVVVTDRRLLDRQIRETIKQFAQVSSTVGAVTGGSDQLRQYIESGKRIIISTLFKFPVILDELGTTHRDRRFAIVIDEAHSSQGGRTAAKMNLALAPEGGEPEEETTEDKILRIMEGRKMLPNASYFAFTATPKNKTLELFGEAYEEGGEVKHKPFDVYTMKQAIQERFILDVLAHYTPVESYYRLTKTVEDDPEFDTKKAQRKLRRYVESHDHALRRKAEIMIDHFHEQVIAKNKIGGQARAMVITGRIERAISYFHAFRDYLKERKSPWRALVAFSGEVEYRGQKVHEAKLNGFPSRQIEEEIRNDPYRFLICADKFQTGYDEPLLHTMYVDKPLSGVRAVQTLSRLNRSHPKKRDTFVLDFVNDPEVIRKSFEPYYRTTLLSQQTDPNKLHDLQADLDGYQVYSQENVDSLVELYLGGAERDQLDPILDHSVTLYVELDEDGQVDFKGKAKAFTRTYGFLASILPYSIAAWEKLSIFLNLLIPKLPAPREDDLSIGLLEAIDMESYRAEVRTTVRIDLPDEDAEIDPVPTAGGGRMAAPELVSLSDILRDFNQQWGNIEWKDVDRIGRVIAEEIPDRVAADRAYRNAMRHSDPQNARIEHDKALQRVLVDLLADHTDLFKHYSDNPSFKRWLADTVFQRTYRPERPTTELEERLRGSDDPLDRLGLAMLETLDHWERLTLGDALALAEERGLTDVDAFLAAERLTRPNAANLRRYYVDRSAERPRLLTPEEVREKLVALHEDPRAREEWTSSVEVAWADSEEKAIGGGNGS